MDIDANLLFQLIIGNRNIMYLLDKFASNTDYLQKVETIANRLY